MHTHYKQSHVCANVHMYVNEHAVCFVLACTLIPIFKCILPRKTMQKSLAHLLSGSAWGQVPPVSF